MVRSRSITHLFLDIGGVLLTNGWDHNARRRACAKFHLNHAEIEPRHRELAELFDEGKLSLEDYLSNVFFHRKRSFTPSQFRQFMFEQSKPYPKMIRLMSQIKAAHLLKVIAVSNEARELNAYRIKTFHLDQLFDAFISSCYVQIRKPNREIYELALDLSHAKKEEVLYIENTPFYIEQAQKLGLLSLLHTTYTSTQKQLRSMGLHGKFNTEITEKAPRNK